MITYETKETLLLVEGINKKYDVPVLRDISLEIKNLTRADMKQGQIVSLVGKSGSGKSTLFRILAGLEKADSGNVKVCSGIITEKEPDGEMRSVKEGNMGGVFQNSYIYTWRKVKSILDKAERRAKREKNPNIIPVDQLSESLDIQKLMDKYPSQLSGGQRQRVALAEQLIGGSEFILLDEPFSGLDTLAIDKVTKILSEVVLTDDRKTLVIVSHDLSNSLAISDTAFILAKEEGKDGATITHKICLATEGLAWQPDIKENPKFRELLNIVKSLL